MKVTFRNPKNEEFTFNLKVIPRKGEQIVLEINEKAIVYEIANVRYFPHKNMTLIFLDNI